MTGMRFKLDGDEVVSLEVISEPTYDEAENEDGDEIEVEIDEEEGIGDDAYGAGPEVLVVTNGGMGKRSYVSAYRKTKRGARGVVNIRLKAGEEVLSVVQVQSGDEILLTTERGQLSRIPADEIRRVGRASQGVRIMNLNAGDRLTGVARIADIGEESKEEDKNSDNAAENIPPAAENSEAGENNSVAESTGEEQ